MPLIDQESLKSFFGDKNFTTSGNEPTGHEAAVKQAEDIVYQKTGIAIPAEIANATGTLQFCAHAIYSQIISQRQQLKVEEINRRKDLFNTAMKMLDDVNNGELPLLDSSGSLLAKSNSESSSIEVSNCHRSERL